VSETCETCKYFLRRTKETVHCSDMGTWAKSWPFVWRDDLEINKCWKWEGKEADDKGDM
jgi:hypothetical protein